MIFMDDGYTGWGIEGFSVSCYSENNIWNGPKNWECVS